MNKNYESFRNGIMYVMRTSGLELGAIFYVLKDILREVEEMYSNTIRQEIEEEERRQREAEETRKTEDEAKTLPDPEFEDVHVEADNDAKL